MSRNYLRCFPFIGDGTGNACLLLTLLPFSASSVSPWHENSGHRTEVTSGYATYEPGTYPLYVSGAGSELVVNPALRFYSEATSAALVENKGTLTINGASFENNAAAYPALTVSSGYLDMANSSIRTWQSGSHGVVANGRSVVNIRNTDITLSGTNGYGIEVRDDSSLIADGLNVNVKGKSVSAGVTLNGTGATARITNSQFNLDGGSVSYGIQQNLGELIADGVTIIAKGQSGGVRIGDWGPLTRTTLANSYIQVENEYALLIRNSLSTLNNVDVIATGDNVRALDINQNASVIADGGSYTTYGKYADAVWLPSQDTQLTIKNASLTTSGDASIALNALAGTAKAENVTLTTSGVGSYGIYTTNQVAGNNLSIKTSGERGWGVISARGGQLDIANSTITTQGASASGIGAFSQARVQGSRIKVMTHGKDASALFTQAASLNIDNSSLISAGNAPALAVKSEATTSSGSSTQLSQVRLDNVRLIGVKQEAINVKAARLHMQASNGAYLQGGNQQLLKVVTVNDAKKGTVTASHVELEASNRTLLNGDVKVDPGSTASLILRDQSQLTGAVNNADIAVYSQSLWRIPRASSVQNIINQGTVAFKQGAVNHDLVVAGNYAGNNGALIFNTRLGNDSSATNRLIVQGNTSGATQVRVLNAGGVGAKTLHGIKLIEVNGLSAGEFVQQGRVVAGAYEYQLGRGAGASAGNWYLMNHAADKAPVFRPEVGGYIANSAAAATLFNLSLYDRLGNRSLSESAQQRGSSLWLRQTAGHNRAYSADTLEAQGNRYSVQLGGDLWQLTADTGRLHIGPMLGYGRQATNIRSTLSGYTANSAISGYSLGAYATWFADQNSDSGLWLDSWLQYNWFTGNVAGEGLRTENYHMQGISGSLEGGYAWKALERQGDNQRRYAFYLQPHAQLIFNGLKTVRLTEHNGTRITNKNNNFISRIGVRGWITESKQPGESDLRPYVELNWLHNSDPYQVRLNQLKVQQNSGRNVAELKTGVEGKVSDNLQLNGSIALQQGRYHYQDASLMLGAKYSF
ncbi:autotransporter outer membrane beta-barrel domain-containing protein [Pantoea alhagi]|uniref:autotransporter family protein n=1 Tax=Pantoea alhagi TaxID=1891675 RepID=UPI00202B49DD|nr:autotransporter outer membrane beta-barrel domain-containing protein [Pantoea alhagi]URQ60817.1 autotransporter outer membrane beta-barrel domain-containing protein [Pantoea alhagi]